jgi:hypothetical protein
MSTLSVPGHGAIPYAGTFVLENIYKVVYNRRVGGAKWGKVGK